MYKTSHSYYITPIASNLKSEKRKFLRYYKMGRIYNPQFRYRPIKKEKIKDKLQKLKSIYVPNDGIYKLFYDLKEWRIKQTEFIFYRASPVYTQKSSELYPLPSDEVVQEAYKTIKSTNYNDLLVERNDVTHLEVKEYFVQKLREHNMLGWNVMCKTGKLGRISVNSARHIINIRKGEKFDKRLLPIYFVHEVLGHARRVESGKQTGWKILTTGTAYYSTIEEGLAMYLESVYSNIFYPTRLHLICGYIIAIDVATKSGFYKVFDTLVQCHFSERQAFEITTRVKSGFTDTSVRGAYTKPASYYVGYLKVKEYIADGGKLDDFYVGRCSIKDFPLVKKLQSIK